MSLSKDIHGIHSRADKFFGTYAELSITEDDRKTPNNVGIKTQSADDKRKWIDQQIHKAVSETMRTLVDLTNGQGADQLVNGMLDGIHRTHRYLQGEFITKYLTEFLTRYGELNEVTHQDGRNELAKKLAVKMGDPHGINLAK